MNKYAFILGRNPELSIAELGASLREISVTPQKAAVFFSGELPEAPQDFLNRLGGTVEILEIFEENLPQADILKVVEKFLLEQCRTHAGKCAFALNLWPENKKSQVLKFLLPRLKKSLRANGISANFMNKNFQNVSPVFASKQGLIGRKTNIGVFDIGDGKVSLGFTVALQDFEAYSKRDYGKPFRDPAVGMLPPKLAQIMVNLGSSPQLLTTNYLPAGQAGKPQTISDPFCGTGTILMEALLMGYDVIGSDKDARLVDGAQQNIDWLRKAFQKNVHVHTKAQLFQKDTTALVKTDIALEQPFAIVTEPYLGPALISFPAEKFLEKLTGELENLYIDFFASMAKWLPKKTPVVFVFPYWKKKGSARLHLAPPLVAKIEALGYSKTTFVPLQTTSLFYDRPDSIVGREIVRFVKN
jgi:tRNA G10  N-methylase Trm11